MTNFFEKELCDCVFDLWFEFSQKRIERMTISLSDSYREDHFVSVCLIIDNTQVLFHKEREFFYQWEFCYKQNNGILERDSNYAIFSNTNNIVVVLSSGPNQYIACNFENENKQWTVLIHKEIQYLNHLSTHYNNNKIMERERDSFKGRDVPWIKIMKDSIRTFEK